MSNENTEHSEDHGHGHPSVATYVKVAILLTVITAVEVAIPELVRPIKDNPDYNRDIYIWALYILSIVKFGFVIWFFMHLKYDTRFFTHVFMSALIIAVGTFIVLMVITPSEPPVQLEARLRAEGKLNPPPTAASASTEVVELSPPDAEAGKAVFGKGGCAACHVVSSLPGAVGNVGPTLDGLAQTAASRVAGMDAEAYIKQSIEDPYAFIVEGYMKVMPNMRATMTDQEFVDLVAFLQSL